MLGQDKMVLQSPYLCQARCRKTAGCVHFSWWGDGGCHLQDQSAVKRQGSWDAVGGPPTCQTEAYCFKNRHRYEPLNMENETRSHEVTPGDCQARCYNTRNCEHFTYFSDGGCHIQDGDAERIPADNEVLSGPATCDYTWVHEDGYIPRGNNMLIRHMTVAQAKLECISLRCEAFTFKGQPETNATVKVYIKSTSSIDLASIGIGWVTYVNKGPVDAPRLTDGADPMRQRTAYAEQRFLETVNMVKATADTDSSLAAPARAPWTNSFLIGGLGLVATCVFGLFAVARPRTRAAERDELARGVRRLGMAPSGELHSLLSLISERV